MLQLIKIFHAGALIDFVLQSVFGVCVSIFELFLVELLCRTKQEEEEPYYSENMQQHVPSVLCLEPVIEIWVLICSLSLWHLIHPFPGWYNLASAWHCVNFFCHGKILTNCFCKVSIFPLPGKPQRWHCGRQGGLHPFRIHWRPLCGGGSPNHPNCDGDQQHSLSQDAIAIQQCKCYIRSSSACKWRPLEPFKKEHCGRC